ncbi:MAG: helix-turn-helix domain-containing protein [Polyangiaceae bacterium]
MGTRHDLPGATFGPREQFSWELVWVRVGGLDLQIDERRFHLKAGSVAIVPPMAIDRYEWIGERRVVHSFVHFNLGPPVKGWPARKRWAGRYELAESHLVHHALDALTSLPVERPDLWTVVGAPLLEVVLRVLLMGPGLPSGERANLPVCVDRALDWMRARVTNKPEAPFQLDEVAKAARVDRAHLCRVFRSYLDVSPMQCARLMRLDRAIARLERSDDSIKEIAEAVGFANSFHFSRCFSAAFRI